LRNSRNPKGLRLFFFLASMEIPSTIIYPNRFGFSCSFEKEICQITECVNKETGFWDDSFLETI